MKKKGKRPKGYPQMTYSKFGKIPQPPFWPAPKHTKEKGENTR